MVKSYVNVSGNSVHVSCMVVVDCWHGRGLRSSPGAVGVVTWTLPAFGKYDKIPILQNFKYAYDI